MGVILKDGAVCPSRRLRHRVDAFRARWNGEKACRVRRFFNPNRPPELYHQAQAAISSIVIGFAAMVPPIPRSAVGVAAHSRGNPNPISQPDAVT